MGRGEIYPFVIIMIIMYLFSRIRFLFCGKGYFLRNVSPGCTKMMLKMLLLEGTAWSKQISLGLYNPA